jgi:hypothetical protein
MSAKRSAPRSGVLIRIAGASAAVLGGLLAAVGPAAPAHAEEGDVRVALSGLSSDLRPGRSEDFSVRTENRTEVDINAIRRVIVVQLGGLSAGQVTVIRRSGGIPMVASSPGPGQVRFDEALGYHLGPDGKRGDSESAGFQIRFDESAPGGEVTVTAYAMRFNAVLGSASDSLTLNSANVPVTPTPTPTAAPSETDTTAGQTPVRTLEPDSVAGVTSASGIPPILYVLGGVLVLLGGGILWLLFRPNKPALVDGYGTPAVAYDTRAYEQVRPPSLGYPAAPRHAANVNPTTVMPAIDDPSTPPPVDPWADGDRTQQFPRHLQ